MEDGTRRGGRAGDPRGAAANESWPGDLEGALAPRRVPAATVRAEAELSPLRVGAEEARGFYERHGFEPSPTDPLNLQLLIKDTRAAVDQVSS